jgi:phenylacetate-CoA ligase
MLSFYFKLPASIQNLVLSIQGYRIKRTRFNSAFEKELKIFEKSNPQEINISLLKLFLVNAERSDFWKQRFKQYGVNINSDNIKSEIQKLPILTKNEVQENLDRIKVNLANEKIKKVNTSGTTGTGLVFQQTQLMENKQWAVWWRYRKRHGINMNMWMGWFGGRTIMNVTTQKPPFWRINYFGKQVMFSSHHLNSDTVSYYHKVIVEKELKWLHGYPSQLAYLATLIKEKKLRYLKIDYITLGAENLLNHQENIINEVFGVMPIQHYGLAEGVANISQLPSGYFQVDQDFAMVEFIPTAFNKNVYKIIGTNYSNFAFPLFRYDTNDLINVEKLPNGENRIISIDGRNEDFITLPNGIKLGRLDHIFKNATFVKEAQIYQPTINEIVLKIVPAYSYSKNIHENFLVKECKQRFGTTVNISFEYLNQIPKTKSGKLKFVISEV